MNLDLGGAEAVFAKRSVLPSAAFVSISKFFKNGLTKHTVALAVDKYDAHAFVANVFIHHSAERINLEVKHIGRGETGCGVDELGNVKVNFKRAVGLRLLFHRTALRSGITGSFGPCLAVRSGESGKVWLAIGAVVLDDVKGDDRAVEIRIWSEAMELEKFRDVHLDFHAHRRLRRKWFTGFISQNLQAEALEGGDFVSGATLL